MPELTRQQIQQRKIVFFIATISLFFFLLLGFFKIQIYEREKYFQISLDNSVRQVIQFPVRGTIRDINNRILVDNRPSFLVSIIPRQLSENTTLLLAQILDEDPVNVRNKIRGRNSFRPVIIKRDLQYNTVAQLEEQRLELPGVLVQIENKRYYKEGVYSPHIFGYVGEVTKSESQDGSKFDPGEMIGKTGLEFTYDSNMRGVKGVSYIGVDAEGRDLGILNPERNVRPIAGMDLYLTIDYSFQQFAESLMVDKRGAIIALDPRNGSILAFVSKPDYNPRIMTGKILTEVWQNLVNDPEHPLYSRGNQSMYPPGSTYKLVAAIAALQEGIITPEWTAYCPGYYRLGRKTIHCWNEKGHGKINIHEAIKGSCNVFFYQLGLKIGLDIWSEYSKKFFFGEPTGIDLPNEGKGLVPTVEYFNKVYGRLGWTKGNLANLAIGQGELIVTPIQMAQFAMILATKGVVHTPHLTEYLYDYQNDEQINFPIETNYVQGISDDVYDLIRQGMLSVVDGGTGWRSTVPGIQVAGKTGTAQNPGDDHAWFIAFAPYDNPVIALVVIIENGGGGGSVAAPIAGLCLEKYFYGKILPRIAPKKDIEEENFERKPIIEVDSLNRIEITLSQ